MVKVGAGGHSSCREQQERGRQNVKKANVELQMEYVHPNGSSVQAESSGQPGSGGTCWKMKVVWWGGGSPVHLLSHDPCRAAAAEPRGTHVSFSLSCPTYPAMNWSLHLGLVTVPLASASSHPQSQSSSPRPLPASEPAVLICWGNFGKNEGI